MKKTSLFSKNKDFSPYKEQLVDLLFSKKHSSPEFSWSIRNAIALSLSEKLQEYVLQETNVKLKVQINNTVNSIYADNNPIISLTNYKQYSRWICMIFDNLEDIKKRLCDYALYRESLKKSAKKIEKEVYEYFINKPYILNKPYFKVAIDVKEFKVAFYMGYHNYCLFSEFWDIAEIGNPFEEKLSLLIQGRMEYMNDNIESTLTNVINNMLRIEEEGYKELSYEEQVFLLEKKGINFSIPDRFIYRLDERLRDRCKAVNALHRIHSSNR